MTPPANAYSPAVAFGLYAVTTALRAKAGKIDRADLAELEERREALVPEDAQICAACEAFAEAWGGAGLADAAEALMDAVVVPAELQGHPARIEAALTDAEYPWQLRADLQ
ncbi:MAG: hypothetical protein AAF899_06700 [Pseudomonadota bacterium]